MIFSLFITFDFKKSAEIFTRASSDGSEQRFAFHQLKAYGVPTDRTIETQFFVENSNLNNENFTGIRWIL